MGRFRDVSLILRKVREFLLGRAHVPHNRFPPCIAPRTIPPPDVPRAGEAPGHYKYADQYYYKRSPYESVKPPVVAPVAQGPPIGHDPTTKPLPGGIRPDMVCFTIAPTPGLPWWWDGHCYFECTEPDPGPPPPTSPVCKAPPPQPPPSTIEPPPEKVQKILKDPCPPCPTSPDCAPKKIC